MDILDVNSEFGKYQIILKEISFNQKGYIIFLECYNLNNLLEESLDILKKNGCKEIYLCSKCSLDLSMFCLAYQMNLYHLPMNHFKSEKDIKLRPLELANRSQYKEILNSSLKNIDGSYFLDNLDVMKLLREKCNGGLFEYKKENVGAFLFKDSYLKLFCIDEKYRNVGLGERCLKKLVTRINQDLYAIIPSTNLYAISLFEKIGFQYKGVEENWYVVDNENRKR